MTAELERKLRTTQRRMVRWIVGVGWQNRPGPPDPRRTGSDTSSDNDSVNSEPAVSSMGGEEEETFVEWIKRATQTSEMHCERAGIEDSGSLPAPQEAQMGWACRQAQ